MREVAPGWSQVIWCAAAWQREREAGGCTSGRRRGQADEVAGGPQRGCLLPGLALHAGMDASASGRGAGRAAWPRTPRLPQPPSGRSAPAARTAATSTLSTPCPPCPLLRYDAVTTEGQLAWQDGLTPLNRPFFDACDALWVNYTWKEGTPARVAAEVRRGQLGVGGQLVRARERGMGAGAGRGAADVCTGWGVVYRQPGTDGKLWHG